MKKSKEAKLLFKTIGTILALSLKKNIPSPYHIKYSFYKLLLGKESSIRDLQFIDPVLYQSIKWILDPQNEDQIDDLCLTFTYVDNDSNTADVQELKKGGSDILVTRENKDEFINLIVQKMCSIKNSKSYWMYQMMKCGFRDVFSDKNNDGLKL